MRHIFFRSAETLIFQFRCNYKIKELTKNPNKQLHDNNVLLYFYFYFFFWFVLGRGKGILCFVQQDKIISQRKVVERNYKM